MLWAPMPEAPIAEHDNARPCEHNVGPYRLLTDSQGEILAEAITPSVQLGAQRDLRLSVTPTIRGH